MAHQHTTHSAPANNARPMVGPAMLLEVSHLQHGSGSTRYSAAEIQKSADQDLVRLLAATTLCGLGLLILALIR